MKKRYSTNKDVNLIHEKILFDYPELRGKKITEGYENPLLKISGDGTFIDITVPDSFDIRKIDDIINNFVPTPRQKPQKTKQEVLDEIVTEEAQKRGYELI